jgi:hypothetical protein
MKKILAIILFIVCATTLFVSTVSAVTVFEEYFDTLTDGQAITTSNTDFDYVRIGPGGGLITAEQAASGEMYMRLGGSPGGSLTGVGIQSSLSGLSVTSMNFRLNLEDTNGDIFIGMGTGATFTGNATFNTAHLMWAIQSDNGNLEFRTDSPGQWNDVGQTLTPGQNYEFHIVANRSGATINYGTYSVATGNMDLFLDGVLVGDDLDITNNQNATGFRIYQINGGSFAGIDSITIDDTAVEPFTPTAVTLQSFSFEPSQPSTWLIVAGLVLLSLGSLGLWWARRGGHRSSVISEFTDY